MCLTLQGEQFPGGGGRVCRWGVDTPGKETSSMWEIYAISPRGSDIEEAICWNVCACACVCVRIVKQKRSSVFTLM